mgnify:CR=1 FL=1
MALSKILPASQEQYVGARNLIINGNAAVSQRGVSAVAVPNGGYSTVDRMKFYESTGGAYTSEQSSDVPAGQGFSKSIKLACTTADTSIGAAEIATMSQVIEGQNLQRLNYGTSDAKTITLSFWVKSNKTGIYTIAIYKHAGGGTAYGCPVEYTISSANTWEKKTITVTPTAGSTTLITSSAGAIIDSNGAGIEVHWGLAWGSDYNATNNTWSASGFYSTSNQVNWLDSTSNNFYITGIQLEIGDVATPFEHESFAATLEKCRRFFIGVGNIYSDFWGSTGSQMVGVHIGASGNNGYMPINVLNPTQMRATPTAAINGTPKFTDFGANRNNITGVGITSQHLINFTYDGSQRTANEGIGVNAGDGGVGISLSAEL